MNTTTTIYQLLEDYPWSELRNPSVKMNKMQNVWNDYVVADYYLHWYKTGRIVTFRCLWLSALRKKLSKDADEVMKVTYIRKLMLA